jgi:radical SAM superfamily enzyme YgiQ (UPF0313 family)
MKICLVPFPIVLDAPETIDQKYLYPYLPLGLLILSALLEQAGHEITIVDPVWEGQSDLLGEPASINPEHIAGIIASKTPELVGFSTIFSSYPLIIRLTEHFHRLSPKTPILLGGPQATAADVQTLQAFPWIDMVLRGEAEKSIIPLVTCLQSGNNLESVPGLTWRNGTQIIRNPDAPVVTDLDTIPIPAYHLYPVEQLSQYYNKRPGLFHHNFALEAGRGCPFNCSFCSTSSFFQRRYRMKSADRLINEMISLHKQYGLKRFDLTHDLFTCNRAYVLEFCHSLREKDPAKTIVWECYSRPDTVDSKVLLEMAAAGCSAIFYGIETGSPRMQRSIGKNLNIQQVKSVTKETLSLGIRVSTSFICGFPQEREEDLSATLNLAMDMINMGVNEVVFLPLFPLLDSELYREFGDTLRYDGPWSSDILYGCLNEEDQELVLNWPRIFASFYHYETPGLDYDMLRALLRVIIRYPLLLAILSTQNVNIISVFKRWPEWYHSHVTPVSEHYYLKGGFFLDFFQFLLESLNSNVLRSTHLEDIINYYTTIERVASTIEDSQIISEVFNSDISELMRNLMDGKPPTETALQPTVYLFWKSNGRVVSKSLTLALGELPETQTEPSSQD